MKQMKQKIIKHGLIFAFVLGIALILYPSVSDYINTRNQSKAVQNYQDTVSRIGDSEKARILELAAAYNKRLAETPGAFYKPEQVAGYAETLDITGTGIMGYLNIDKLHLELPVYHTVEPEVLQIASCSSLRTQRSAEREALVRSQHAGARRPLHGHGSGRGAHLSGGPGQNGGAL